MAEATPGFVGADLNLLVQQAYYKALDDAAGNEQVCFEFFEYIII